MYFLQQPSGLLAGYDLIQSSFISLVMSIIPVTTPLVEHILASALDMHSECASWNDRHDYRLSTRRGKMGQLLISIL